MLLFIFALLAAIIGFIVLGLSHNDFLESLGGIFFGVGSFMAAIFMLIIILEHTGVSVTIVKNQIEYEALCERQELVSSEYEDVSKSDVITDIAVWNKKVYSYKHWAYNPWTSWFYSKKIADNMEMIE